MSDKKLEVKTSKKDIRIGEFIHDNRNMLIIVCDPKTDKLIMAYKDKIIVNQIKSVEKTKPIVKSVLRHSTFETYIEKFISGLAQSLELSIKEGNQFYQWIDGCLYNLSKVLSKEKNNN